MMEHIMFIQKVKDGKKDEYMKAQKECWAILLRTIKESGIKREILWIQGNDIYTYIMTENFNKSMAELCKKEIFIKWRNKIKPLLAETQDFSGESNITKLEKIFDLEAQLKYL